MYCDCQATGDIDTNVSRDMCGALIIIDLIGDPDIEEEPERGPGLDDSIAVGINVWTPGERFLDLDDDNRWDGIDEKNDMMCHGPDGCAGDPPGSGPRGCTEPGCGELEIPACDW
ncbi:MAG: hypothetical protein IIB57_15310, partial [Planctomycetes bacterium]|nr:hypothetical protein [Planctomycetota bacterium]